MGNCLARHSIRHVSGSSTAITTPPSSNPNSSERKGGIPAKTPQAQGDGGSREKVPSHTQSMDLPDSVAGGSNSSNYMHDFTYADLKTATRNFRTDSFLGEGGFGSVYRGNIDERTFQPVRQGQGIQVAVKKLTPGNFQGHNEWMTEVKFLGTLKHPNLVKLIGHCSEEDHRLLVYEFLTRGSLEHHLFGGRNQRTIPWSIRLKVAVDAARGLCFLHEAEKPVIYRDFKAANILLDSDFNAKLSDFGLAKDGPTGEKSHVTTRVLGTYGYAAPEYVATGRLSAKSDVYSFGVVLLEILTGRRAVDKDTAGVERNLVEWAMPYLQDKRKWYRVLDQRLEGQYSLKGAKQAASIALHCLDQDPKQRPTMKDVLESLERVFDPKSTHKNSSSDPSSSQMRSPMRGSSSIEDSRADHHRHGRPAKQEQTVVLHPPTPANAFKLPSPQQMATK